MSFDQFALVPIWYVVFLLSTVCHEAAHALVAKWGGDNTAYVGGQVSLDPMPHIKREPFGLVFVPLFTLLTSGMMIGWGSAPFDPFWQIRYPRRAALMALAGPMTNFFLAALAGIAIHIGISAGIFEPPMLLGGFQLVHAPGGGLSDGLATFLSIMFLLNVILGAFNLVPMPPLDGYTVMGLFLPEDLSLKLIELARTPMFSIFGILLAWQIFPYIVRPVMSFSIRLLFFAF